MYPQKAQSTFLRATDDWICDNYFANVRYIAFGPSEARILRFASITFSPLPPPADSSFSIETNSLSAGSEHIHFEQKVQATQLLEMACNGRLAVSGEILSFDDTTLDFYSEVLSHEQPYADLHLDVIARVTTGYMNWNSPQTDSELRAATPPFDGLLDLTHWLGLRDPFSNSQFSRIAIRINPPADLILRECNLSANTLNLTLHAHPSFDTNRIGLAVRSLPAAPRPSASRMQCSSQIVWSAAGGDRQIGHASIDLEQADSALAMFLIGNATVRRHWFLDSSKARNSRWVAFQKFDTDLRMVKQAILDPADAYRFEKGIAALLYLAGFSSALPVETDSPDIIASTPAGRLVLIECTTRIADFSAKLGKLVDRRGGLESTLRASNSHAQVEAVLVCSLPKSQIAAQVEMLRTHRIVLVTREHLSDALDYLRVENDPDSLLDRALNELIPENQSSASLPR